MITRGSIARRYRYLWIGEVAAIAAFLIFFWLVIPPAGHWSRWIVRTYALAIFLGILLQGVFWWRGRLRLLLMADSVKPTRGVRRYRRLRWLNWLLIAAFPLVVAIKGANSPGPFPDGDVWWGVGFIVGALLEQVNYYHFQLTYGYGLDFWYLRRNRRLRRGNIARYLDSF